MRHIFSLLLAVVTLTAAAQIPAPHDSISNAWPLSSTYYAEVGAERAFNTYISPLLQTGTTFGFGGEWTRGCSRPERSLSMNFNAGMRFGFLTNPAHNAACDDIALSLGWSIQRGFSPMPALRLSAGAGITASGGLLYLPSNSNNPVAARLYAGITLNGTAAYDLHIFGKTLRLLDAISLPTLGVFFSPHYGQSYYEIYLGEHEGLARCGWWGNHFCIDNLVAVEVPVCSSRIRLGYRLSVANSIASSIESRITTHSFVLGITTDWLNITRRP